MAILEVGPAKAEKRSIADDVIAEASNNGDRLSVLISRLAGKVHPILADNQNVKDACCAEGKVERIYPPLYNELRAINSQLQYQLNTLEDIISRIEL